MDWLTKQKTYVWLIILLVVLNLTTLVLLWIGRPGPPPMIKDNRLDTNKFLKNELDLSDEKEKMFRQIRQTLFDSTSALNKQMWEKRREVQEEAFKGNPDTQKINILSNEIGDLQSLNEKYMFNHFSELKKLLSEEQLLRFKRIISKTGKKFPEPFEGERQGPPPGGMPPHQR
jgi:hypothetical protein